MIRPVSNFVVTIEEVGILGLYFFSSLLLGDIRGIFLYDFNFVLKPK